MSTYTTNTNTTLLPIVKQLLAGSECHLIDGKWVWKVIAAPSEAALEAARKAIDVLEGWVGSTKYSSPADDESDAVALWAEIWRLRAAVKGPNGYASWQDAATDERIRRVKAERKLSESLSTEWSQAARDVLVERQRQITAEGWTPQHDDEHSTGDLARAAACYANPDLLYVLQGTIGLGWPWSVEQWKPAGRRRNLIKAGALILAELERLDRALAAAPQGQQAPAEAEPKIPSNR